MKSIFLIFLICISSFANAQSNRQRLDDIEDKLDGLILQQQLNEIERMRRQNEQLQKEGNRTSKGTNYKNTNTFQENLESAHLYNLSYAEYIRRDEINHTRCVNSAIYHECYQAGMIGISLSELDKRKNKWVDKCSTGKSTDKEMKLFAECFRKIVVLGK